MADIELSVIHCSATGTIDAMARRIAQAGEEAGAEVRLRHVQELAAPERVATNTAWSTRFDTTEDEPKATIEDLVWADAVLLGVPTRCDDVASQLKQYSGGTGGAWARGLPANEVYAGFTSTRTAHGGQGSTLPALYDTIHHLGGIRVPHLFSVTGEALYGHRLGARG